MQPTTSLTTQSIRRGAEVVWHILGVLEVLLLFRFCLLLLHANPEALFTSFIYRLTHFFAFPFLYVFPNTVIQKNIFEWSTFLAMFVYWLLTYSVVGLFTLAQQVKAPKGQTVIQMVEQDVTEDTAEEK